MCKSLDLRTNEEQSYVTEDRSALSEIAVSASMVAALSLSGKCFVWASRLDSVLSIQLPSARSEKILLSGNALAIIFRPDRTSDGSRVELMTWTLDRMITKSFFAGIETQEPQNPIIRFVFDAQGATILLLERMHNPAPTFGSEVTRQESVRSTRFDLAGVVLAQGRIEYPGIGEDWNDVVDVGMPAQANHPATIWSIFPHTSRFRTSHLECRCIRYDFRRDCLILDRYNLMIPYTDERTCLHFWKDIAYYWTFTDYNPELHVVDLQESTCERARVATIPWPTSFSSRLFARFAVNDLDWGSCLRGDEIFHIRAFDVGFVIYCFDKHVKVGSDNARYKDARKMMQRVRVHADKDLSAYGGLTSSP